MADRPRGTVGQPSVTPAKGFAIVSDQIPVGIVRGHGPARCTSRCFSRAPTGRPAARAAHGSPVRADRTGGGADGRRVSAARCSPAVPAELRSVQWVGTVYVRGTPLRERLGEVAPHEPDDDADERGDEVRHEHDGPPGVSLRYATWTWTAVLRSRAWSSRPEPAKTMAQWSPSSRRRMFEDAKRRRDRVQKDRERPTSVEVRPSGGRAHAARVAAAVPTASSRLRLDLPHEDEHRLRAHLGWEPRRDHIDG